jgi:catechol 2,3-dioxygenase-like lactoylglutathione lyase family enzyme
MGSYLSVACLFFGGLGIKLEPLGMETWPTILNIALTLGSRLIENRRRIKMIDHLSVGVTDIEKATSFYTEVLGKLGTDMLAKMDSLVAFGQGRIEFIAMMPHDGNDQTSGNGVHVAFKAANAEQVDAFHKAALENGGTCDGAPGTRPYPHAEVYAAFVRDPFGNKLEALSGGFAA